MLKAQHRVTQRLWGSAAAWSRQGGSPRGQSLGWHPGLPSLWCGQSGCRRRCGQRQLHTFSDAETRLPHWCVISATSSLLVKNASVEGPLWIHRTWGPPMSPGAQACLACPYRAPCGTWGLSDAGQSPEPVNGSGGEAAGARDHAAQLPGNEGHHGNRASTGWQQQPEAPPLSVQAWGQWCGPC